MTKVLRQTLCAIALTATTACSNIECPLDNLVEMSCGLYEAGTGSTYKLTDSLTITSVVGDTKTVLLNRAQGISSFLLPLRQTADADTLLLRFSNSLGKTATDSIILKHANAPHFESLDCPAAVFHSLQSVCHTSHALSLMPLTIDSVAIVRKTVNYDNVENLKIYLRSTSDR